MLDELTVICKNKSHGCKIEVKFPRIKGHIDEDCLYQIINCQAYNKCKH